MIIETGFTLSGPWGILAIMAMTVAMLVNRAGASMVFFDVVGRFQAKRLISDAETSMTLFNAIMLDTFANIQDSINVLGGGIAGMVENLIPAVELLEDAEIQLRKFAEAAGFEEMAEEVQQLGFEFGYTADAAMDAASRMAQLQSVLGQGQTATGTRLGMEFGIISGMETEEAMTRLINLNQQLGFMQENTEDMNDANEKGNRIRFQTIAVLDQLNTIENRSAATMEQITFVMNQFAAQAKLTGESIAAMAAQSAVLIEAGEEQGKAGRALKMVYARLGGDINGARTEMEKLGIATQDANTGALRPMSDVLTDLSQKWETFNGLEQQNIAQTVAGNRHYTRFIKLMENWNRVTQLTFEGQMRLTPAMDEVNTRLQAQITEFRGAEAELEKYRAELGQQFLPAMTEATKTQTLFVKSLSDGIEFLGPTAGFIYQLGEDMKNLVAPIMGVITNIAALTLAISTNRSVTRAMQGEEIALQEAYGNAGMTYTNASRFMTELGSVRNEEVNKVRRQLLALKELTQEEIKANQQKIKNIEMQKMETKQRLYSQAGLARDLKERKFAAELDIKYTENALDVLEKKDEQLGSTSALTEQLTKELAEQRLELEKYREGIRETAMEIQKFDHALMELNIEQRKYADEIAGDVIQKQQAEREAMDAANDAMAMRIRNMYTLTTGLLGLGSAIMVFAKSEKQMKIGMTINTAAIAAMTAQQVLSVAQSMKLGSAIADLIKTFAAKYIAIHASIEGYAAETRTLNLNTAAIAANQRARDAGAGQAIMLKDGQIQRQKELGQVILTNNKLQTGTGAILRRLLITTGFIAAAYVTVVGVAKLWKWAMKDVEESHNWIEATAYSMTEFNELLTEHRGNYDNLSKAIQDNKDEQERLHGNQMQFAKDKIQKLQTELAILNDIQAMHLANKTIQEGTVEDYQSVGEELLEQIALVEKLNKHTQESGMIAKGYHTFVPYNVRESLTETGRIESMIGRLKREEKTLKTLSEDNAALYQFIQQTGVTTWQELSAEMEINADLWREINGEIEDIGSSETYMTRSLREATDAMFEFNNAREEFFFGSTRPNMVGDLTRQVLQKGVENLITTTEVVMTNNFNGMTTEQAAEEILNQIERGAGRLGWDLVADA